MPCPWVGEEFSEHSPITHESAHLYCSGCSAVSVCPFVVRYRRVSINNCSFVVFSFEIERISPGSISINSFTSMPFERRATRVRTNGYSAGRRAARMQAHTLTDMIIIVVNSKTIVFLELRRSLVGAFAPSGAYGLASGRAFCWSVSVRKCLVNGCKCFDYSLTLPNRDRMKASNVCNGIVEQWRELFVCFAMFIVCVCDRLVRPRVRVCMSYRCLKIIFQ